MLKSRTRMCERVLAIVLAFVMVFTSMPASIYAGVSGYEDYYTISVLDSESNAPIEGASVTYSMTVDGNSELTDVVGNTDANGVLAIDLATAYTDIIGGGAEVKLSYSVEKDGYTAANKADVVITDVKGSDSITLQEEVVAPETYTVTVNTGAGGTVTLNGSAPTDLGAVMQDTVVTLNVTSDTNYAIESVTIDGIAETITDVTTFAKDITVTADTVIDVTFVSTVYKIVIKEGETPVEGALVKYNFVKVLGDGSYESLVSDNAGVTTVADGTVVVDLYAHTAEIVAGEVYLTYIVTKDGYVTEEVTEENAVAVASYNGETVVSFNPIQMHTVTVSVTGNGTVAIDGVDVVTGEGNYSTNIENGTEIAVEITAPDGAVIQSVRVNGTEQLDSNTQLHSIDALSITEETTIDIIVVNMHVVNVTTNEADLGTDVVAGVVTLNDVEANEATVEEGTDIALSIQAKAYDNCSYMISSVQIDGVEMINGGNVDTFTETITVDATKTITVEYVRVYTITITHNGVGEGVSIGSVTPDGTIIVEEGETATSVVATPNLNYRVACVKVDGEADSTVLGNNDEGYSREFESDKNYTIEITFALNRYSVVAGETENGTITFDGAVVEGLANYGANVEVTVTPAVGYTVTGVNVNSVGVTCIDDNGSAKYTITNVTENQEVTATFAEMEKAEADSIIFNVEGVVRNVVESKTYIYANDETVTFEVADTAKMTGIRVFGLVEGVEALLGGAEDVTSVTLSESADVSRVEVYYKADAELFTQWHIVSGITADAPIRIVIDKDLSVDNIQLVFDEYHANDCYYNDDFNVVVTAIDAGDFSGIEKISYWTEVGDAVSQPETVIYTWMGGDVYAGTVTENAPIDVENRQNNDEAVVLKVKVTDLAGNSVIKEADPVRVNCTAPELISIEVTGDSKAEALDGYYENRTVTITVKDRSESFNAVNAKNGISIIVEDAPTSISPAAMISEWQLVEGSDDRYRAIITFTEDAKYTWSFDYTNDAGKSLDTSYASISGENVYDFVVDNTDPTAKIKTEDSFWTQLLSTLTFGIWKNTEVTVTAEASDITAGVNTVLYYKTSNVDSLLTVSELDALYGSNNELGNFEEAEYTVSADDSSEKFVVYARVSDKAGNYMYISTDGIIVEDLDGKIELTIVTEAPNANNIYNTDVDMTVKVTENAEVSSGIKSIEYKVYKNAEVDSEGAFVRGELTKQDTIYSFDATAIGELTYDALVKSWNGNITVSGEDNSSDHVYVLVTVTDNAGNTYSNSKMLAINTDKIKAEISFDNNNPYKVENDRGYFGLEERVATIKVTDRGTSFDDAVATAGISIAATNVNNEQVALVSGTDYVISNWTSSVNNETNETVHTATVAFKADGNYTWSFTYENKAGNSLDVERNLATGDSVTPFTFTVDKVAPTGTISLNENVWAKLLEVITFGLYSNDKVEVKATYEDTISPVIVEYYKTFATTAMRTQDLVNCKFESYADFTIDTEDNDESFVVYLRITDYAGNVTYLSTDGFVFDDTLSTITLTPVTTREPEQPVNGIYNTNVDVEIVVDDAEPYSGIKSIDYWVVMDGDTENPTQSKNLFTFDIEKPTHEQLVNTWNGDIEVEVDKNNSCDVEVFVKVVDNAGNSDTKSVKLDVDTTKPTVSVSYDNNTDNHGNGYFTDARTATVVITERAEHFDAAKATEGIKITATNAAAEVVEGAYTISNWTTVEGTTPDAATHTATVTFTKDANYEWEIVYADNAGNVNEAVNAGESVAPFKFAIDSSAPTGTITAVAEGVDKDEQKITRTDSWDELRTEDFKFGFWANGSITLTGEFRDGTSTEMAKVEYYKDVVTEEHVLKTPLTKTELDGITTWKVFDELKVEEDEQFVVYLKITDPSGNYSYICTNGLIVDHEKPVEETIAPEITTTPTVQPVNDIYNEDVTVAVKVVEPVKGNTYSGLKSVGYKVLNMGVETKNEVLYTFKAEELTQEELKNVWEATEAFIVKANENNSNDVKIVVYAEDNAGNYSEDEVTIMIDTTAPTMEVSYNNNTADNGQYFNEDRVATITITERNFREEDVIITITNTDNVIPRVSNWVKTEGPDNGDTTKWTGTINYNEDGDYTFKISFKDKAGNTAADPNYGTSVAPREFTIDKTLPVVTVSYDNNSAENEKYFDATRTAEVKIVEHNFDVERVSFAINENGGPQPTVTWREEDDVHTAVISYTTDGDYTFDVVTVQDMAANDFDAEDYGNSVAAQEFTVDTEVEAPVITGVVDGKPYGYDEEIIPMVEVADTNYDRSEVHLYRTSMADIDVEVTEQYIQQINGGTTGGSRAYDIFKKDAEGKYNREMEGIYRMTATVWDKAGNESDVTEVVFSINRFGSIYVYDEYLIDLVADGGAYVQEVEQDLIITEYNATKLIEGSVDIEITKDGKPVENVIAADIVESAPSGNRGWYEYQYTISKDNFDAEGTYKIVVSSKDDANNTPENDMGILFRVDKEAPEFTRISGLDAAIVDATELKIDYSVYDAIGLQSIVVKVNGEQYGETITDFGDDINNYSGSIVLGESTDAQSVQLIVTDLSGRVTDTSSQEFQQQFYEDFEKEFVSSVTVTTNAFVRFYANKPLFWGTIGGGTATVAAAGAAIAFFRRRKLKVSSK